MNSVKVPVVGYTSDPSAPKEGTGQSEAHSQPSLKVSLRLARVTRDSVSKKESLQEFRINYCIEK